MTRTTLGGLAFVCAVLLSVPWLGLPSFYESFLYLVFHWIILAVSWNILSGYSGYFSFGHGAFFGVGMYTTAVLTTRAGVPVLWTLPVAAIMAAALGLAIGAVVFRLRGVRGELFALLTLAVTFIVATLVLNTPVDGGPGIYLSGIPVPALGPTDSASIYLFALVGATFTLFVARRVQRSALGMGLFAIHDDEDVAETMGVPCLRYKLAALGISCALAGAAGGLHAIFVTYVTAVDTFNVTVPLTVVLMSVLGGSRHWAGPALGATLITVLLYVFASGSSPVVGKAVVGIVLIVAVLFMPSGITGALQARLRRRRASARSPGTPHDPSHGAKPAAAHDPPATATATLAAPAIVTARNVLEVRGLCKSFKGLRALDGVDLQVRQGEILGLLGPNGSGKSTFINVVSGHLPATSGSILFESRELVGQPAHRIARAGMARTYQIPRPFSQMTVFDNVAMVATFAGGMGHDQARREAWKWLEFAGLQDKGEVLPEELNLHQRKFLELARALAARPKLVLLDEVLSGLTPGEINEAVELIRRINQHGATIVFVEHVMRAVMALTDRIAVLNHGKLLAHGLPDEVMNDAQVIRAYLGGSHA